MSEELLPNTPEEQPKDEFTLAKEQIEAALRADPRFLRHLEPYNPISTDSFIQQYAFKKVMWLRFGENAKERNEAAETQWMDEAAEHLTYILQKKLFDAQCLWRAEQVVYEGVEISTDFYYWETHILNCPFLEPVTEVEVALYQQFLESKDADLSELPYVDWQEYEYIKDAYHEENSEWSIPAWYEFHNSHTGANTYMALPDIRGEKEERYLELVRQKEREEHAAEAEEYERTRDKRPMLPYRDAELMRAIVNDCESAETRALYEAYTHDSRHSDEHSDLYGVLQFLLNADEPIPIESHPDFRTALYEAETRHRLHKISEHLPMAYEEYQLNLSLGLRASEDDAHRREGIVESVRKMILEGRRLAGEPENFDF